MTIKLLEFGVGDRVVVDAHKDRGLMTVTGSRKNEYGVIWEADTGTGAKVYFYQVDVIEVLRRKPSNVRKDAARKTR